MSLADKQDATIEADNPSSSEGVYDKKAGRRFVAWTLLPPILLLIARETIGGKTILLTQAPAIVNLASYAIGLCLGGVVARKFWSIRKLAGLSDWIACFMVGTILYVAAITFEYLGRWVVEIAAFTGMEGKLETQQIKIMQVAGGRRSGKRLSLMAYPEGREFNVDVTPDIYVELRDFRPPLWSLTYQEQPYCVALPIEHGRWSAIRAHIPARWEAGLNSYQRCRPDQAHLNVVAPYHPRYPPLPPTPTMESTPLWQPLVASAPGNRRPPSPSSTPPRG